MVTEPQDEETRQTDIVKTPIKFDAMGEIIGESVMDVKKFQEEYGSVLDIQREEEDMYSVVLRDHKEQVISVSTGARMSLRAYVHVGDCSYCGFPHCGSGPWLLRQCFLVSFGICHCVSA